MVVVGADVHKRTHTFVAVNEVGRKLGEKVVAAATAGHAKALVWARTEFGGDVLWGIEDSRNLSARLERDLLSAGQKVVRVAAKLMNQARKFARTRGKSDPIDALDDSVAVGPLVPTATGSAPVTRSPDRADPLAPTRRFPSRASSRSRTRPAASAEPRQVSRTRTHRARRRAPCTCGCRPWAARPWDRLARWPMRSSRSTMTRRCAWRSASSRRRWWGCRHWRGTMPWAPAG